MRQIQEMNRLIDKSSGDGLCVNLVIASPASFLSSPAILQNMVYEYTLSRLQS